MRILFLAPQPFYQDRGTPIAVKALLDVLSQRGEHIDVLTYHIGENIDLDHVVIHRIPSIPFVHALRTGFSLKKLVCDGFLILKALRFARRRNYQLVYAVEEAVFIALLLKILFYLPYIYDMDSSLSRQLMDKFTFLRLFSPILQWLEGLAIQHATAVVPVCDALVYVAKRHHPQHVTPLYDVPNFSENTHVLVDDLRQTLGLTGRMVMYVGNLESYQGIDLLLEGFAWAQKSALLHLVIVGGNPADIEKYQGKARILGIDRYVHFLGPKSVQQLAGYLAQADILVSPRIKGDNTPMKIYSYLASGKPILATDLWTHTQVLNDQVAMLVPATPVCFAEGLLRIVESPELGTRLGAAGKHLVETKYNLVMFSQTVTALMSYVSTAIGQ